jgi:MFS family permease
MSLMMIGIAAGGAVLPWLNELMIQTIGWRWAWGVGVIVLWVVVIPLIAIFIRTRPSDVGLTVDGIEKKADDKPKIITGLPVKRALGTFSFWLLTVTFMLQLLAMSAMNFHFIPFATQQVGFPQDNVTFYYGLAIGSSIIGRLGFGWLADNYRPVPLLALAYLLTGLGPVALWLIYINAGAGSLSWMWLYAVPYGIGLGGYSVVFPVLVSRCFGELNFSKLIGLVGIGFAVGIIVGIPVGGYIFDTTKSYELVFIGCIAAVILAMVMTLRNSVRETREVVMRHLLLFGTCMLTLSLFPLTGCGESGSTSDGGTDAADAMDGSTDGDGVPDSIYANKDLWLCRPDIVDDRCDTADLSMTEVRADGSTVAVDISPNPDAEVDCFYVYHTVDHNPEAGNTETLVPHPEEVIAAAFRNGAHYRGVCRMFAPLYHQMTIGTYSEFRMQWWDTEYFERAYDDVAEAFDYYMSNHNQGRGLVLIGHSQGSHVLTRLLQERFDDDEALRTQLVSAILVGHGAAVHVPVGERVGGRFENIPLCASATETGCVIAFDANPAGGGSIWESALTVPSGMVRACVNPSSFDDGPGTLASLIYPRIYDTLIAFPDGIDTEWVRYPDIYTSSCSENTAPQAHVLEIDLSSEYAGDVPITPQELQTALVEVWGCNPNLHCVEYFLANTDLVRIVEQQIASR